MRSAIRILCMDFVSVNICAKGTETLTSHDQHLGNPGLPPTLRFIFAVVVNCIRSIFVGCSNISHT